MDKQRIVEIAEMESFNHIKFISEDKQEYAEYYFNSGGLQALAAAILLEAARICDSVCRGYDNAQKHERGSGAARCYVELKEMAKELTQ